MIKNKTVGLIAACDITGLIGYDGKLAFKNAVDQKRFKQLTMGTTLIMGSKTFDELPEIGLPGRKIHVLSRKAENTETTNKFNISDNVRYYSDMFKAIEGAITPMVWIAGGGEIYKTAIDYRVPDIIDLTIFDCFALNQKRKQSLSINMPEIGYVYRVISETQNEEDLKLYHRRYEIRLGYTTIIE